VKSLQLDACQWAAYRMHRANSSIFLLPLDPGLIKKRNSLVRSARSRPTLRENALTTHFWGGLIIPCLRKIKYSAVWPVDIFKAGIFLRLYTASTRSSRTAFPTAVVQLAYRIAHD
jgi:hypothetical protein